MQLRCTLADVAVALHKVTCSNPYFDYVAALLDMACLILREFELHAAAMFEVRLRILHQCRSQDSLREKTAFMHDEHHSIRCVLL